MSSNYTETLALPPALVGARELGLTEEDVPRLIAEYRRERRQDL
jgi:hypothetical protein